MRATLNYYLARNYSGFKNFVCEQYFYLSGEIQNYERTLKNRSDAYEEYSAAVFLCGLYDEFYKLLTEDERASIKYLRYHNPDDKVPERYDDNLKSSYWKWIPVFFTQRRSKLDKSINSRVLGLVMKRIRKNHNISATRLADIIGVDRSTIYKYENNERLPTLINLFKFCHLFNITIDELISTAVF